MIRWLMGLWYAHLRRIDIDILWPACIEQAPNLDLAKAAFTWHVCNDPAWLVLEGQEMFRIIDDLKEKADGR